MVTNFWGIAVLYSTSFFLPTIVRDIGFSPVTAQLAVAPIYIAGTVVSLGLALGSDKFKERGFHVVFADLITTFGYILLSFSESLWSRYFAIMIVSMGIYGRNPVMMTWLNNNVANETKRASAVAMMISFGNLGGVTGGQVFTPNDAPFYVFGCLINAFCAACGALMAVALKIHFFNENLRRDKLSEKEIEFEIETIGKGNPNSMGDRHPMFRYFL